MAQAVQAQGKLNQTVLDNPQTVHWHLWKMDNVKFYSSRPLDKCFAREQDKCFHLRRCLYLEQIKLMEALALMIIMLMFLRLWALTICCGGRQRMLIYCKLQSEELAVHRIANSCYNWVVLSRVYHKNMFFFRKKISPTQYEGIQKDFCIQERFGGPRIT